MPLTFRGPARVPLAFRINGRRVQVCVEPRRTLLSVLREELGLTGAKHGCGHGACGACTVILDGQTVYACLTLAIEFEGRIEEREVIIPPPPGGSSGTYVKVAERAAWDFGLASIAAQVSLVDGVAEGVRIALGGVAPIPWRATDAERALPGHRLTAQTLDEAARAATAGARPLAHNAYKVHLLQGVVRQALGKLAGG